MMARKRNSAEFRHRQARLWRKLLRLTKGRISLMRSLAIACEEESDASLKAVLRDIISDMERGATLADAACRHEGVFSLSIRELLKSAEKTGAWEEILEEMAAGLEEGTFD